MLNKAISILLVLSLLTLLVASGVFAQDGMPGLDDLEPGEWNLMQPGGDTICSNGTDYQFYVRPGDPERLVFYMQGGGACWFGENCDLQSTPTYDPFVDETDDPSTAGGIFDFENAENPFADYSVVFLPYCTADVHIGNSDTTYTVGEGDDAREVTIHHNGYNNVSAVLDWTYDNFEPSQIFVSGSSAGSIPSPFYGGLIADHYPDAQILVLGDAAGGYYNPDAIPLVMGAWGTASILPDWPEYEGVDTSNLSFELLYIASAQRHPDAVFTQFNTAHDETQYFFLTLVGVVDVPLPDQLNTAFDIINAEVDNFRTYTAGGTVHTILWRPEFYTYSVDGVRFVDWVQALVNGEDVDSLFCTECDEPETVEE